MCSKIHKAIVTQADLDYVGNIRIDSDLLEAVGFWPGEKVLVDSKKPRIIEEPVIRGINAVLFFYLPAIKLFSDRTQIMQCFMIAPLHFKVAVDVCGETISIATA